MQTSPGKTVHSKKQTNTAIIASAMVGHRTDSWPSDESQLLSEINDHGAGPLLDYRVAEAQSVRLPDEISQQLHQGSKLIAAMDLLLNLRARLLLERLHELGIKALLLKGSAVANLHYRASYLRPRCDCDLYLSQQDIQRAAQLFTEDGYSLYGFESRPESSKQFVATENSFGSTPIHFDIHWKLSNRTLFADTLPFEECWEDRQKVPALGTHACALSDIDLLLHACIHRIAHGRGSERNRLIWLYDIHLIWASMDEVQKTELVEKALAKKIGAVCADAIQVCRELFEAECGSDLHPASEARQSGKVDWFAQLRANRRCEPTARLIEAGKLHWALADLMAVRGLGPKLAFTRELIFKQ